MNCYQNMINRVTDIICENISAKRNYILIGDNSSGKSDILCMVMENKLGQAVLSSCMINTVRVLFPCARLLKKNKFK